MFFKKKYRGVILIDVHDCITNLEDFKLKQGLFFAKRHGLKMENPNAFDTADIFDWNMEFEDAFWKTCLPQLLNSYEPKHLAKEAVNKLSSFNYKILILCRPNDFSLNPENQKYHLTHIRTWLDKYNINYDELIITEKDVADIAKKNNITLFISANPKTIENMALTYETIMFNTNYNKNLNGFNITRVSNWNEAYKKIISK